MSKHLVRKSLCKVTNVKILRNSLCKVTNVKILRNSLCKVTNVKMDDNQFLQAVLPAAKGGLGVFSACLLASSAFLASAVGAKNALSGIFGDDALKRCFDLGTLEIAPENEIQKTGQRQFLTAKLQTSFYDQWLNVIPCKNLRIKLSNQKLRIAIGLRLG